MARRYAEAERELAGFLEEHPDADYILKRLIICNTQTGKIENALMNFHKLVTSNIEIIINTDPIEDDCPCLELIEKFENERFAGNESADYYTMLGIIWLYCDAEKSLYYFQKADIIVPDNLLVKRSIKEINNYLKKRTN